MLRQFFLSFLMCTLIAMPVLMMCSALRRFYLTFAILARRPRPVSWIDRPLARHLEEFRSELSRVQ